MWAPVSGTIFFALFVICFSQVALNAHQWLDQPERWNRIKLVVSEEVSKFIILMFFVHIVTSFSNYKDVV
jgi:hypothetical protein